MIKVAELLPGRFVLPIFKNGRSSIEAYVKEKNIKWMINEQLKNIDIITVFLRHPTERFISGVHSFIEFEKRKNKDLDYHTMLYCIEHFSVSNEHFMPQFFFLKNLTKYFNGLVDLRTVSELKEWIPNRNAPAIPLMSKEQRDQISKIKYKDMKYDNLLFERHMYTFPGTFKVQKKIQIKSLVEEIENALSQA